MRKILLILFLIPNLCLAYGLVTGGSFTQKNGSSTFTSGDSGFPIFGVRNDNLIQLSSPDLSYSPISLNNKGQLSVSAVLAESATAASAAGAPSVFKVIAGLDGTSTVRPILTDATGKLQITSANASVGLTGSPVPTSASFTGIQNGANLTGLSYGQSTMALSLPVAIASNQTSLPVTQAATPWLQNVTQFGGNNVVTGTGASGVGIPRFTVSNDSNVLSTESGTWTVQPGNTPNTSPWLVSLNQGGLSVIVTAANALKVDPSGNGLALDTSVNGLLLSQNSTTSGQKGILTQGAVTTASPSYSNANTSPLSLNTSGGLRVDGSGVTQPVSGLGTFTTLDLADGSVTGGASGSSTVLMGVRFNTALPTLTNGQQAAAQSDSSGRILIGALTAGSSTIGAVTQASGPWTTNLTQFGSSVVTTGQAAMAASIPVVLASNQTSIKTTTGANVTGAQTTGNVSTIITITPPANAIGFILQAKDTNTANIRWAVGASASTVVGQQLQPGRDTGFVPLGANVSAIAESATQEYEIQWVAP